MQAVEGAEKVGGVSGPVLDRSVRELSHFVHDDPAVPELQHRWTPNQLGGVGLDFVHGDVQWRSYGSSFGSLNH